MFVHQGPDRTVRQLAALTSPVWWTFIFPIFSYENLRDIYVPQQTKLISHNGLSLFVQFHSPHVEK